MPRAFCPECAAEVPVDEEGSCFLGHEVPAASASSRPDVQDAVEEPEPWVAKVTDRDAEAPEDEAAEDEVELDLDTLEQAVAEMGLTAEDEAEDTDEDAFAVFEEEPTPGAEVPPAAEPEVDVHEDAVADVLDVQGAAPQDDPPEPEPDPTPQPDPEPTPQPDPEPTPQPEPEPDPQPEPAPEAPEEEEPVDTANFLARPKDKRRGLFGR